MNSAYRRPWRVWAVAVALTFGGAALAAPRVDKNSAGRAQTAARDLRATLKALASEPTPHRMLAAQRAMGALDAAVDTSYHAENLTEARARPHARALRTTLMSLVGGPEPLLVVTHDVVRYRPDVTLALARAAEALGEVAEATDWARRARAAGASTAALAPFAHRLAARPSPPKSQ